MHKELLENDLKMKKDPISVFVLLFTFYRVKVLKSHFYNILPSKGPFVSIQKTK